MTTPLRDFLLATERAKAPLDAAVQHFAAAAADDSRVLSALLDVSPQAEPLLLNWPDESGKGTRWEDRESIALFLEIVAKLLHAQTHERNAPAAAEAMALKIVREKSASLEKMLTWSDKPIVEFRVLELMAAIAAVNATAARELVRVFNFQSAAFSKIAGRRLKKATVAPADDSDPADESNGVTLSAFTKPKVTAEASEGAPPFQIREVFVRLVAQLAGCPDKSVHRFALKDGGIVASLFKSIDGDDADMLAIVLGHLDTLVLGSENIDERGRAAIFSHNAIQHLIAVLKNDDESVARQAWTMIDKLFFGHEALYKLPANQSLRLLVLKSSVNVANLDDAPHSDGVPELLSLSIRLIRTVIGSVGLNDYVRSNFVRELVSKFILAYPGLVAEFFSTVTPQLEPKNGYRWFCVASMVQNVLSCSLQSAISDLQSSTYSQEHTYSAQLLASRLVMPLSCRKELSRGLQHASPLVIYASLGLIECALRRFQFMLRYLPKEVTRFDFENELRFLLPSPETLVSLLMKLCVGVDKAALVYLRSLTVFRLYLECLPLAMNEVKADFTKLLAWRYLDGNDGSTSRAIRGVVVGEILRILLVVDESKLRYVATAGSIGNGESSKLSQLLQVLSSSTTDISEAVRSLTRDVLFRVFVALNVFGSKSDISLPTEEISIWLDNMVGGGQDVANFVEMLLQDLVADPFAFLTSGPEESVSPSPATLALISALRGVWPYPKSASKLEHWRKVPVVEAFGSRVLLSLIVISVDPASIARLVGSNVAVSNIEVEDIGANKSTKKRRRCDTLDMATLSPLQCVVTIARCIESPSATHRATLQFKSAVKEWKTTKNKTSFGNALHDIDAHSFEKNFSSIVANMLQLGLSSQWLHQFIASRPDVDVLLLIKDAVSLAKTKKEFGALLLDVVGTFPVELLSQRILFILSVEENEDKTFQTIKEVANQLTSRLDRAFGLTPRSVASAAEQLLCCVGVCQSRRYFKLSSVLIDVVLRLRVSLGNASTGDADTPVVQVLRRLHYKITRTASISSSDFKLAALNVLALLDEVRGGKNYQSHGAELHRQGATVVTAVMVDYLPVSLRLDILVGLLERPKQNYPLVVQVLKTLDQAQILDYKSREKLSRLLWDSLSVISNTLDDVNELEVLSPALHVVGSLGGVSEAEFSESVKSKWSKLISRRCTVDTPTFATSFEEFVAFLRRLFSVVSQRDVATKTPQGTSELVESVMTNVDGDEAAQFRAVVAILVSTYGSGASLGITEYLRTADVSIHAFRLAGQSASPHSTALALTVLRHAVLFGDLCPIVATKALEDAIQSAEHSLITSPPVLLALLMMLGDRMEHVHEWSALTATFLVRSAISFALSLGSEGNGAKDEFSSIEAVLRDMLKRAPSEVDVRNVLKKATKDIKKLMAAPSPVSPTSFYRFVRASKILTLVLSGQNSVELDGYSIGEHFERLTANKWFPQSLRDPEINVEVIRLVACMLQLGGGDLYGRGLFQNLLGAYNMSLSLPDRMIRCLFEDFESKAGILASQYGYRFGSASAVVASQKVDGSARSDLVEDSAWLLSGGLEPSRVRATIENFPLNRGTSAKNDAHLLEAGHDTDDEIVDCCNDVEEHFRSMVYDPSYLLPMLARFVASSALPETAMIQQGVVGIALRSVSSNSDEVREFAYGILAHVHESLSADAGTDFKPGRQVHLMLDTLRNALQQPLEGVSSVITVFMNDAISILCRPGHTMYPHVNHFLLARPAFDLSDVPMFYSLFNSHSPQTYKQERSWLLHGLRRGVREDEDVSLLIRRHVPSILLSFFGSDLADEHTQLLVGSILSAMLKTEAGAAHLLLKCAFLEWLTVHIQVASDSSSSTSIVSSLANLLEGSLKSEVWMAMDPSQREALGASAAICFDALAAAVNRRTASLSIAPRAQLAQISLLLLQRASAACSLSTLRSLVDVVKDADSVAIECVDELISGRLLLHREFQKSRFVEWSGLLADVMRILARESHVLLAVSSVAPSSIRREIQARDVLRRLRAVLAEAPSLRLLVLGELGAELATKIMLL